MAEYMMAHTVMWVDENSGVSGYSSHQTVISSEEWANANSIYAHSLEVLCEQARAVVKRRARSEELNPEKIAFHTVSFTLIPNTL